MSQLIPLPNLIHFRFQGPDAERYLSGQVTQLVEGLPQGHARATFVCDAKGRILFDATIYADQDGFLLTIAGGDREEAFARMDRYLIADDCTLNDESDKWSIVHELLEPSKSDNPEGAEGLVNRFGRPGRDRYLTAAEFAEIAPETLALTSEAKQEEYRLQQFVPRLVDLAGAFSAETGLEDEAVSFHKGCYLGQEVISRIKRAGKTNRQLVSVHLSEGVTKEGSSCPIPFKVDGNEKTLLEVTSVAQQPTEAGYPALGYLSSRYPSGTALTSAGGISATLLT